MCCCGIIEVYRNLHHNYLFFLYISSWFVFSLKSFVRMINITSIKCTVTSWLWVWIFWMQSFFQSVWTLSIFLIFSMFNWSCFALSCNQEILVLFWKMFKFNILNITNICMNLTANILFVSLLIRKFCYKQITRHCLCLLFIKNTNSYLDYFATNLNVMSYYM